MSNQVEHVEEDIVEDQEAVGPIPIQKLEVRADRNSVRKSGVRPFADNRR